MFAGEVAMSLEQPDYTVVYKDGAVEYRQYEPFLVSETVIENTGDYQDAGNEGFRRLFRYITGANQSAADIAMTAPVSQTRQTRGEKIAMTAPVQQQETSDGWTVAFMLPTKYTLETAPVPTDPRVRVREVPGKLVAVLRYSGRWTERNFNQKQAKLLESLAASNVNTVGEMQTALYDPPYKPWFMRRNEVMIAVDRLPAVAMAEADAQQVAAY
jgi:hypothetical protein